MALQLSTVLETGLTAEYWRVMSAVLDYASGPIATVEVAVYKDAAARAANKDPAKTVEYTWSGGDFTGWLDAATLDPVNKNPQERAYAKLKTLPEFTGATDV